MHIKINKGFDIKTIVMENLEKDVSKRKIQNTFNDKSAELGCKARIGGAGKQPKFFEFRGTYEKGYEVWYGIDSQRFSTLISNYPQLHD